MRLRSKFMLGLICVFAGGICWGFSGYCGQYLLSVKEMDPAWLTSVRMLSAGAILSIFTFFSNKHSFYGIWKERGDVLRLLIFGIFGLLFCQYTYVLAIKYSNAGTATVLQYMNPIIITIIMCFLGRRLPMPKEIVALILAISGTFLIATHGNPHTLVISPQGLLWGITTACAAALYNILPRGIISKWGSPAVNGFGMLAGGIVFFLAIRSWRYEVQMDLGSWLGMAGLVIVGTVLAFSIYLKGVSLIGPIKASLLIGIEPVAAALFSHSLLGTSFAPADILGFALIISTVLTTTLLKDRKFGEKDKTAEPSAPS